MMVLVQDILKDALGLTGAIAIDETPTTSEYTHALRTANVMIDRWATQRLLLRSTTPISFPLVANKASYTIGASGSDITGSKPTKVYSAFFRDQSNIDTPLDLIDITTYNNLSDKDVSAGNPMYLAYDPGEAQQSVQKGTFYVYYMPSDATNTIYAEVDCYLTEFVNLTDVVTFEPAYYEALIYNLATRLFRYYRSAATPVPLDIMMIAQNSINNLKAMNSVTMTAGMELPGKVGKYNIYTDGD